MPNFARKTEYQREKLMVQEFSFDTLDSAGTAPSAAAGTYTFNLCDLPAGAIVTTVKPIVVTAFNSATSDVMIVGDSSDTDRYMASASVAATGEKTGIMPGFEVPAGGLTVKAAVTGVGTAPTTGKILVVIGFILKTGGGHNYGLPAVT